MTTSNQYILLDGALARDLLNCDALVQQPEVWPIYDDLGSQAAAVGPILTTRMPSDLIDAGTLANVTKPQRRAWGYAHTVLRAECDAAALATHLRSIRYLRTRDGQRFYFRYADARCMLALWPALDASQRGALLGPIRHWAARTATGQTVELEVAEGAKAAFKPLVLSDAAADQLTRAMGRWNLLGAAEEADASIANRDDDAQALQSCDRASSMLNQNKKSGFAVETMLAVALIRSGGNAESDASFQTVLRKAVEADDPMEIHRWVDVRFNS